MNQYFFKVYLSYHPKQTKINHKIKKFELNTLKVKKTFV